MKKDSKSSLIVEVLNASDVPRDRLKKNDPYIVVFFKGLLFIFIYSLLIKYWKIV